MKKFKTILYTAISIIAAIIFYLSGGEEISGGTTAQEQEQLQEQRTEQMSGQLQEQVQGPEHGQQQRQGQEQAPQQLEIPATPEGTQSQILRYTGHTLSYNRNTLLPNWVAYELTREEAKGNNPRNGEFEQDPQARGPQANRDDYRNSGWDRGHMAPAGDMKWSTDAMEDTYYFTNICPQNHELNTGDWNDLEIQCRKWAKKYGSVYIVCGPIVTENTHGKLGKSKITIPDKFFKVVLTLKNGEYHGVGFIFHNPPKRDSRLSTRPGPSHPLETYAVTIDEVETATGLDFFHLLQNDIENKVEQQKQLF